MSRQAAGNDGKALVATGITSVACPALGDCAAAGGYVDGSFNFLVFVTGQHRGKWARARPVPGVAALVANGQAAGDSEMSSPFLSPLSCSSPGNCAVAGNYQAPGPAEATRPLLADERAGVRRRAHRISGPATAVLALSCPPAPGDCAAGGFRQAPGSATGQGSGFVVSENRGAWGRAELVPGSTGAITSMSCPAAGNCLAGGPGQVAGSETWYPVAPTGTAFLVSERNGRWGRARPVPGLGQLASGKSEVGSISCTGAGDCAVGGSFIDRSGRTQVFVASERGSVWGPARPLPGLAALNLGGRAELTQLSCASPGDCAAGGSYLSLKGRLRQQAWVATETAGHWGPAEEVPGTPALNGGEDAAVTSLACTQVGCVAGGWYTAGAGRRRQAAFLVTERHGTWRPAFQVPGLAAVNTSGYSALVTAVSCAPSGWCAAVGDYTDITSGTTRMFVTGQR